MIMMMMMMMMMTMMTTDAADDDAVVGYRVTQVEATLGNELALQLRPRRLRRWKEEAGDEGRRRRRRVMKCDAGSGGA